MSASSKNKIWHPPRCYQAANGERPEYYLKILLQSATVPAGGDLNLDGHKVGPESRFLRLMRKSGEGSFCFLGYGLMEWEPMKSRESGNGGEQTWRGFIEKW